MPGIVGLTTKFPREVAERQLHKMLAAMCYEEFYSMGTWIDEALGIYVGWVARKGSFADGMPLRNERGDVLLAFGGEEFPEPGIRQRLKEKGHKVEPYGPSYLVHLYEEEPDFFAILNGRFHGLVADLRNGSATLFNDRYGLGRLYYHESKEVFYFAAEAKAILAIRPELRTLDSRGLGEFVACGTVLENRTLFEGIEVLPPGSAWIFRNRSLSNKSTYFQPKEWENQEKLDGHAFYQELRATFARNLPRYFEGREPIAMSLTGGLDTRMVMAWQKEKPGAFPCYTFGSVLRENHDVRVAKQIADICQQPFQVITAGQEFLSRFPCYAERSIHITDGGVEMSRVQDLFLSEKMRQIAPVRMTGDYGGEILRGVGRLKTFPTLPGLYKPEFLNWVRLAEATHANLVFENSLSFLLFRQAPWDYRNVLALEESQIAVRSPFLDNDLVRTAFKAPQQALLSNESCLKLIADGNPKLAHFPTDRGLGGSAGKIPAVARRAVLEFQFKAEYAYDMGMPQWVARLDHSLSALQLEKLFLGRHKVFHFRTWYRHALSGYVREMLLDSRSLNRPYLNRKKVEQVVTNHLKGTGNFTTELHKLLTIELVHRLFVDERQRSAVSLQHLAPAGLDSSRSKDLN